MLASHVLICCFFVLLLELSRVVVEKDKSPTKLDYYDDMWKLHSTATLVSHFKACFLILDRTIFYPQGGGQPAHTGFLIIHDLNIKCFFLIFKLCIFVVLHYGVFEGMRGEFEGTLEKGKEVSLSVDENRRKLNSRYTILGSFGIYFGGEQFHLGKEQNSFNLRVASIHNTRPLTCATARVIPRRS
ncbi:alanyl-tRNA synthetase [Medicago truncatula]|uniref:Alanyl-tRNA synthetase n=1 Tax=Medicago truncatula TaxID=3880 RepID=G7JPZ7_MEDTR|nr:alanyl-tRNA synthetase [Medicago truncatula]